MKSIFNILMACAVFLMVSSCGIQGDPVAPDEIEPSKKIVLEEEKLSDIDPMVAEGAGNVVVVPLGDLNKIGRDYNSDIGIATEELDGMFERIKPAAAYPRRPPREDIF